MIFRALDSDGDWQFGGGKSSYAKLNSAIVLNLTTTLKTFYSECFYYPFFGQPWFDIVNEKNKPAVVLFIKNAISVCYGIVAVNEIEYTYTINREFEIKYDISTQYEKNILGTVTI